MRAIFIRHGESTANAGILCDDHTQIALTDRGYAQAVALAEGWSETPSLIALSPYLRTHLTAEPTMRRFPDVPVEVLPMQEFTYLEPARWNRVCRVERVPDSDAYWSAADPSYCDGPGAESFSTLLRRVETTLNTLEARDGLAFAFTHGHFMQALRVSLLLPGRSDKEKMESVWTWGNQDPILNAEMIVTATVGRRNWALRKAIHSGDVAPGLANQ